MANLFETLTEGRKGLALFVGGVLFGTAGIRILKTDDARKVYVQGTAAALRGKDEIMETATTPGTSAIMHNASTIFISLYNMTSLPDDGIIMPWKPSDRNS